MQEQGIEDATRRTRLATERTYLAWWRTGITCLAACVGIGRLVPTQVDGRVWPYEAVGTGFGLLGLAFVVGGYLRGRAIEAALARGEFAPFGSLVSALFVLAGVVLALATIALVLFA
jgi:putative membrane protein